MGHVPFKKRAPAYKICVHQRENLCKSAGKYFRYGSTLHRLSMGMCRSKIACRNIILRRHAPYLSFRYAFYKYFAAMRLRLSFYNLIQHPTPQTVSSCAFFSCSSPSWAAFGSPVRAANSLSCRTRGAQTILGCFAPYSTNGRA